MDILLKIVGAIWALVGAVNGMALLTEDSDDFSALAIILNFLIYIFPGLVLYGIGEAIAKKHRNTYGIGEAIAKKHRNTSEQKIGPSLLRILGAVWAIIGIILLPLTLGNVDTNLTTVTGVWEFLDTPILALIIPGLALIWIGQRITIKRTAAAQLTNQPTPSEDSRSIETRLQALESLNTKSLITQEEYEHRRAEILREI